jgi:uncharacterized protein (DUF885 family)
MQKNRVQLTIVLAVLVALANSFLLPFPLRVSANNSAKPTNGESAPNEMRDLIENYNTDRGNLSRTYSDALSPARRTRFKQFFEQWRSSLVKLNFEALTQDGRIDYLLFKNHLDHELRQLDEQEKQLAESDQLIPFAKTVFELDETRRRMESVDAPKVAAQLTAMSKQIESLRRMLGGGPGARGEESADSKANSDGDTRAERPGSIKVKKNVANRTVATIASLRNTLKNWFDYYNGYDPIFTWWAAEPYKSADQALQSYATFMSEKVSGVRFAEASEGRPATGGSAGPDSERGQRPGQQGGRSANARPGDSSDIVGDPIGREALMVELASEMIPYTPEELIAIARKELAWCETEMKKASRELGYGDDWHKALEHVKGLYVEPGKQPELIRNLALEAIEFMDKHDLITIPPLARESWRMQMMTPERQLVNPFFTGGETISVSYPTNTMSHEQKMMSMRGNNIHFARATVFHELIPGHHLQGFMSARYKSYRGPFRTPFWGEGWALYWELLLWDMGFAKTPENRIGMLFWRMHRCARIIFSLGFHLGQMTPKECIDLLVQHVGHEPENATAEVRRSFNGSYPPLYQAAYLLGGLQIYSLHKELVDTGKMTNRAFHDAVLQENSIPIELVRASLTKQKLSRDFAANWKFYGPL